MFVLVIEFLFGNSGLLVVYLFFLSFRLLIVSGFVLFNKGDLLSVYVYGDFCESDMVDGLFCVFVVFYDWLGVVVLFIEVIFLNFLEWMKIIEWKINGVFGLFFFDNVFFLIKGVYWLY